MSDIASALKSEIGRLARKELRAQLEPFKKSTATAKNQIAALREEVSALKSQIKQLTKQTRTSTRAAASEESSTTTRQRFTTKGFATLRSRLGLSCAEMGQLIGASDQAVRKWEDGSSRPREKYQQAIFALRGVGKREIASRLGTATKE